MLKAKCISAAVLATMAAGAWANGVYISVSVPAPIPSIHPLGDLYFPTSHPVEQPKLWHDMDARERADLWPHLSARMQRHYWRCMTRTDRRAMYALLPPSAKLAIRHRFVFQDHYVPGRPMPANFTGDGAPVQALKLTPEQRQRLRAQIKALRDRDRPLSDRIPR